MQNMDTIQTLFSMFTGMVIGHVAFDNKYFLWHTGFGIVIRCWGLYFRSKGKQIICPIFVGSSGTENIFAFYRGQVNMTLKVQVKVHQNLANWQAWIEST